MKLGQKILLNILLIVASILYLGASEALAQVSVTDSLEALGDRFREAYRFEESVDAYTEALQKYEAMNDSLAQTDLRDKLLLAENGLSMTGFVYKPTVIARHMFSLKDFFLYYPLKDRSWRSVPNQLDSIGGPYAQALYAPSDDKVIYYSAEDQDGIRNIYKTSLTDSLWSRPSLLNEHITSAADEIYPVVSSDGQRMYFASKGLYGAGGYDLYVSEWDKSAGDWSVPVNMGFPYSSPANDFLFVNSEDGRYSLFASDRYCPNDSVYVYVLEYDSMPVRSVVDNAEELSKISHLEPTASYDGVAANEVKSEIPENVDTRKYMDKMAYVRSLRDSIAFCEDQLVECRERYSVVGDEAMKKRLEAEILKTESLIPQFQLRLDEAMKQLQEVEMDFLFRGVVVDPDKLLAEAEREVISETPDYVFVRMNMGEPLTLEMEEPAPSFDYSFKILDQGQFAEDNTIPSGVVYQIQIFSTSNPASVKSLKGLSPVFESRSPTGRYIYRVGIFSTYSDVLSHLNKVKKLGFRSAYIVGYVDGKEMQVAKVRNAEATRKKTEAMLYNVRIIPSGADLDSVAMEGIRQQCGDKDMVRLEGALIVGPFDSKTNALALIEFVEVMGYGDAQLETIKKN